MTYQWAGRIKQYRGLIKGAREIGNTRLHRKIRRIMRRFKAEIFTVPHVDNGSKTRMSRKIKARRAAAMK